MDELEVNKCKCGEEGENLHTCPYQEDINNDNEYMCNCCDYCTQQCMNDI